MMTNKFMYSLAVIAISLSAGIFTPVQSQAAVDDRFAIGDLTYRVLTEDDITGTVSVSRCDRDVISVVIPSSVVNDGKTYTVTDIGSSAFGGCFKLEGVKIPDTVTSIGTYAFSTCYLLESLTLPASVTSMGFIPFAGCDRLACVYYEGKVPELYPSSGIALNKDAFAALTSYYRAENKDSWEPLIDENNKWEERKIECIDKPVSGTKGIAYEYLENETAIVAGIGTASETDIVIPTTVENPNDGKTYIVRSIGNSAFQGTGITSLTMGSSIETIGDNAFQSCAGLTKAMIGSCVRSMGENVFQDCTNLMEVYYDGFIPDTKGEIYTNTPEELTSYYNKADKVFWENATILGSWQNRKALCITETMPGTKGLGYGNFTEEGTVDVSGGSVTSANIVIPTTYLMGRRLFTVTSIVKGAFLSSVFTNMVSIEIPDTVTSIGQGAFQNCKCLTSITIPDSVTEIGINAFFKCTSLKYACIGDGVTCINNNLFQGCTELTSVILGKNVKNIVLGAFGGCENLISVYYKGDVIDTRVSIYNGHSEYLVSYYPEGNASWENAVVDGYWKDRKAIPIKNIFEVDNLTYLVLTEEELTGTVAVGPLKSVEGEIIISDFVENEGITYKVTEIKDCTFYNCSNLTGIIIPKNIMTIGDCAFYNCNNLLNITIPASVTSIGYNAFSACGSLTSITIPASVTSIGGAAFFACGSLTSITIPDSVTSIGSAAFSYCNSLTSIILPNNVNALGIETFSHCSSLRSITIPGSVNFIEPYAFSYCANLTSVYYQGDVPGGFFIYGTLDTWDDSTPTPSSLISYYPEGNATWEAAIQDGQWQSRETATWNPLPPAMAELTYSFDNGILTLSFTGTLEESDDTVNWIPVQEAVTPYIVDINKEKKFYRSVQ